MVSYDQRAFKPKNITYGEKQVYVASLEGQKEISLHHLRGNFNRRNREINWFNSQRLFIIKIKNT